jgi:exo-1,4-beta-D-glucosaminidase
VTLASRTEQKGPDEIEHVTVANPSSHLAFFVHLTVWKGKDGEDIRPIYWDDNYFELMPGEKRAITGAFPKKLMGASKPVIKADGWNIPMVVQ